MTRWTRFLVVVAAVCAVVTEVAAQGSFGSTVGGETGSGASNQAAGQFGTAPMQGGQAAAAGVPSLGSGGYTIGPQDVLEISVFGVPELSGTLIVEDNGTIQLPLLGETPAAGKTPRQLQGDLATRLGEEYLQNPQVMVAVKQYNSRYVVVTGAIKNGVYPLKGTTTLMQLVAQAGGFGDLSDSTVLVLREKNGKRSAAKFDVSDIEKGRAQDVVLQSGDRIVAGESMIKKGYGYTLKALGLAGRFAFF